MVAWVSLLTLVFFLPLVLVGLFVSAVCHELGHAVPALLLQKEGVEIYIGAYSDAGRRWSFSVGRLRFFISYNPFLYGRSCCKYHEKLSLGKIILIIAGGPFTSLLILIPCYWILQADSTSGLLKVGAGLVFLYSLWSGVYSFMPGKHFIPDEGTIIYSDGYLLFYYLRYQQYLRRYEKAVYLFDKGDYGDALSIFKRISRRPDADPGIAAYISSCESYLRQAR